MSVKAWSRGTVVSWLMVLAVVVVAAILAIVNNGHNQPKKTATTQVVVPAPNLGEAKGCASDVKYYAYSAPKGSNQFGPAVKPSTTQVAMKRLELKECTDPLFAAVIVSFFKEDVSGISPAQVEDTAKKFIRNRHAWRTAIDETNKEIRTSKVAFVNNTYETLLMVPGRNRTQMPKLGKTSRSVKVGWALRVTLRNGATRLLRLSCDLQPSQLKFARFGIVRKSTPKSVSSEVPSSGKVPVVVTTPVKTPPTKSTSCHCVSTTQASQPVQDTHSPITVNTGKTPGAPAAKPTNTSPKPVTNTNNPAPDPTSEGSSSGSTDGTSGVPSGSSSGGGTTTTGSDNGTSNPVCGSAACTSVNSGSSAPPS